MDTEDIDTLWAKVLRSHAGAIIEDTPIGELTRGRCTLILESVLEAAEVDRKSISKLPPLDDHGMEVVRNAVESRDLKALVTRYNSLKAESSETTHDVGYLSPTPGQQTAVVNSWMCKFSGDAHKALWNHIVHYHSQDKHNYHANHTAIVQSSGMGKSRTVDELAKVHLVIPINLRPPNSTGYPPADHDVRDFLTGTFARRQVYARHCHFMEELFNITAQTLKHRFLDVDDSELASKFRTEMTDGQSFQERNYFRKTFYGDVVKRAERTFLTRPKLEANSQNDPIYITPEQATHDFPPAKACDELVSFLQSRSKLPDSPTPKKQKLDLPPSPDQTQPMIILAFDEAHSLTEGGSKQEQWTHFSELRHVLRALHRFPNFSLFLSTTGKISQFIPAPEDDVSLRIITGDLSQIPPFTDLAFDVLARKVTINEDWNLEEVTRLSHMAHLGRPLFGSLYDAGDKSVRQDIIKFAAAKILNAPSNVEELSLPQKVACLAQRLPLEFYSVTYTRRLQERRQVECHMRVCLQVDPNFESMVTTSASEALLSEAAYGIMTRPSFNVPEAMMSVLDGFSIDKGDRGEFLVMLLFTIARDKVIGSPNQHMCPSTRIINVAQFLNEGLLRNSIPQLGKDLPHAYMHFNHYVKVHQARVIEAERLLLLLSRGAGVLCATCEDAIDGINPFVSSGTALKYENLGLILWQSKNDQRFTNTVQQDRFDAMDVYKLKILREDDAAIPIIKIFFALAARTASVQVKRRPPSADYQAIVYEVWCSGITPDVFTAVDPSQARTWPALLQASYGWKAIYRDKHVNKKLRRALNAGAGTHDDHWTKWSIINGVEDDL